MAEVKWEYAHVYTEMDGRDMQPKIVSEDVFLRHPPDGYTADGTPYWNYVQKRRIKAGNWETV